MWRKECKVVYIILLGALLLRTIVPLASYVITGDETAFHDGDTPDYLTISKNLITSGRFTQWGPPEIVRTPGYPLFLIPGMVSGHVELVTVALQVIVSCFTVYLVYGISRLLFGCADAAALAAAFYATEPLSILYSSFLMTETLFTAAMVLSCYFFVRYSLHTSVLDIFCAGAALVAAVFVRPIAYHLVGVVLLVLAVWWFLQQRVALKWVAQIFVFLIVAGGPVIAWQVRYHNQTGHWGFSAISDMGLYNYLAGGVLAEKQGMRFDEHQVREMENLLLEKYPQLRNENLIQRLPYMREEALKMFGENRLLLCKVLARRALVTFFEPVSSVYLKLFKLFPLHNEHADQAINKRETSWLARYLKKDRWIVLLNIGLFSQLVLYWVLAGIALPSSETYKTKGITFFFLITVYLLVTAVVGGYYSRFRHPLMPFLCVLSGYGASILHEKTRGFLTAGGADKTP
jgi:hypothetical protein